MDQLKPIIDAVKKYHFWVISGAVLLIVLACWWMSTSGLAGQYQQRESKIKSAFTSLSGIPRDHPGQNDIDDVKKKHDTLKKNVYQAWETLFGEQQKKNPIPTDVLGEDFEKQFRNLKPGDKLAGKYRNLYQNYIKHYLPKLREMIDVLRPVEKEPGEETPIAAGHMNEGVMGGRVGGAADVEWTGVIDWNQSDYTKLEERFEWPQTPTTLEVVMAQEDLWVYEALLRAIKNVNEGAADQNSASIKKIEALEIGKDAVNAWKQAENVLGLNAQGQGAMGAMGEGMGGGGGMPGDEFGMGGGGRGSTPENSEEQIKQQLFEFRYIDDKGKPLPFQPQAPHVKHPYAEFKMMPIRMRLVMDQRKIPELLVECANSNMPVEVRRVRFLKTEGGAAGLGTPTGGRRGGFMGEMGMGNDGGGLGPVGGVGAQPSQEAGQLDAPVEIHAIIYIYNPPDREKLGTGSAAGAQPTGAAPAMPQP